MARPEETKNNENCQKRKGKKRKHLPEAEQEVASKAFIIAGRGKLDETNHKKNAESTKSLKRKFPEATNCEDVTEKRSKQNEEDNEEDNDSDNEDAAPTNKKNAQSTKSLKRRFPEAANCGDVTEKRSKHNEADNDSDNEDATPTLEQLRLAQQPENKLSISTVRQTKKLKLQQRLQEDKLQSGSKEKQRNEQYLHKWKNAQDIWRFEKLRQISIQQSIFDEQKIDMQHWPWALEYLSASKGAAREAIVKSATEALEQMDKECAQLQEEAGRQHILQSVRYKRARELLQNVA